MFTLCLSCVGNLGRNDTLPTLPVGERIAFDPARGRLWVVCRWCQHWNLVPLDERWETVEACERLFRGTRLRYSTSNIGLAHLPSGLALIRIGSALRPEIAAWRYGRTLQRWLPAEALAPMRQAARQLSTLVDRGVASAAARFGVRRNYDLAMWLRLRHRPNRVVALAEADGARLVVRARHLETTELVRPDPGEGWSLRVGHDGGFATLGGDRGLALAGKLLSRLNGGGAPEDAVRYAVAKLDDAGNPDGYFARVAAIAMRYWWGREKQPLLPLNAALPGTEAERLALHLTKRSFWGRGGFGSEPSTPLPRLPLVDRLALEMAAHEDTERRALEGELADLERQWRDAEALAAISDNLFFSRPVRSLDPRYGLPAAG